MASRRGIRRKIRGRTSLKYKSIGSKYDPTRNIFDIVKLLRKDLKIAYPNCKFKVRDRSRILRCDPSLPRHSKPRREYISVVINQVDFPIVNPNWVRWKVKHPDEHGGPTYWTPEAEQMRDHIGEMVSAYYRDEAAVSFVAAFDLTLQELEEIETAERLGLPIDAFVEDEDNWWN